MRIVPEEAVDLTLAVTVVGAFPAPVDFVTLYRCQLEVRVRLAVAVVAPVPLVVSSSWRLVAVPLLAQTEKVYGSVTVVVTICTIEGLAAEIVAVVAPLAVPSGAVTFSAAEQLVFVHAALVNVSE